MRKGCIRQYFQANNQKQKHSESIVCNMLFPHVRQQLSDKSHAIEIEGLASRLQALELTNETHQQTIKEKDAAIVLLNDDLKNCEYENVVLQAQRDVYKDQLQKCQDIITHLKKRYVDHAKDPGKDNIVMIIEKNTAPEEDEFYEYPNYIAGIQRRFPNTKRRWYNTPIIDL